MSRYTLFVLPLVIASSLWLPIQASAQESTGDASIQELRVALKSLRPYLPVKQVQGEIDLFGSTSMDSLAHGWANGFTQFHPDARIKISAEGSESVFKRLASSLSSIAMFSRPVTAKDLEELGKLGLKQPVAIMIARDALGVFVHPDNPLESISYAEMVSLFCSGSENDKPGWGSVGVEGEMADKPVVLLGRDAASGTRTFVADYVFAGKAMRDADVVAESNAKLLAELEKQPAGIMISDLKCGTHSAKCLKLRADQTLVPSDDHAILVGKYPLIRPLTLVFDMGQAEAATDANREFIRYALSHAGQVQAVLSGFYPFDPPTLRGELLKVDFQQGADTPPATAVEKQGAQAKTESGDASIPR